MILMAMSLVLMLLEEYRLKYGLHLLGTPIPTRHYTMYRALVNTKPNEDDTIAHVGEDTVY